MTPLEGHGTCWRCRWFDEDPLDNEGGICRRRPPVVLSEEEGWAIVWPGVELLDWCGEFEEARC